MDFLKVYNLPLHNTSGYVYGKDGGLALNFATDFNSAIPFPSSNEDRDKILRIINGEENDGISFKIRLKNHVVSIELKDELYDLLFIRRAVTACGSSGYSLCEAEAAKTQSDFSEYIISRLSRD